MLTSTHSVHTNAGSDYLQTASTGIQQYTTECAKPHSYYPFNVFPWRYCNSTRRGWFTGCTFSLEGEGKGSIRGKNKTMQCTGTHKPIITNYLYMLTECRPTFSTSQVYLCEINFVQVSFSTSNSFINMCCHLQTATKSGAPKELKKTREGRSQKSPNI